MRGRVCLVTGGSSGIGLETARGLAALGATVALTGRGAEKTEAAAATIRESTGNEHVHAMTVDLSSLADVASLADRVRDRLGALHVLVANAGVWHPSRTLSADGLEDTFAVNHLAHFALTMRLLPLLRASAPARVVVVSSRLHERERRFDFDDVMIERRRYSGIAAYRQSKLANVMFATELARRLEDSGVTSNSLHPGDVATAVTRESPLLRWAQERIGRFFLQTAAQGAATSIHLATAPELAGVSGRYFRDRREARLSAAAVDREACERLFALSEQLAGRALDA